jgi:hypothetical protein
MVKINEITTEVATSSVASLGPTTVSVSGYDEIQLLTPDSGLSIDISPVIVTGISLDLTSQITTEAEFLAQQE